MGYLPEEYQVSAEKAFEGLKKHFVYFDNDGRIYLTETVKVGTLNDEVSNGSYDYYISVDRRVNDFKGVAAFLYLAIADEQLKIQNTESNEK
jgi:unsaturated rhamnogalacturonyl hydrolase